MEEAMSTDTKYDILLLQKKKKDDYPQLSWLRCHCDLNMETRLNFF